MDYRVAIIIPALNEAAAIATVLQQITWPERCHVIVVDNGSTDSTASIARNAGATVVAQPRRGYGNACFAGVQAAGNADVLVFLDGDGSFDPAEICQVLGPLLNDRADLVVGSRALGGVNASLLPHQRLGNQVVAGLIRRLYHIQVTDVGPFRAIRRSTLESLGLIERTYGWTTEMLVKAARRHVRIVEVPISYRDRLGGESKVSGTLRGTVLTAYRMLSLTLRHAWRRSG
jgi:glycosyltransferase involved in cell wall biosynthesis